MKRVLVLGSPGAGKTYFSKKLAEKTKLPLIHMDNLYWSKDKVACTREELEAKIIPILKTDEWIMDGNYHHTLELRLKYCTDVFFLDFPREDCVSGIKNRIDQSRDDIPWVETEEDAEELINWTEDYMETRRPYELKCLAENPSVNVLVFYSRKEMDEYLEEWQ
ncbi:MAG: adenylate kinase [Bacilli bacterium]|nr:adenylate kinase [Bacilli bacterium]